MELYTIQVAQWRLIKDTDIEFYNVARKGGDHLFAPSTELLWDYKQGKISQREYTERYYQEMRVSINTNPESWKRWFTRFKDKKVALACYCGAKAFCHRHLLVKVLVKVANALGIEITVSGEITKESIEALECKI